MGIINTLSTLAIRPLLDADGAGGLTRLLGDRLGDGSQRLLVAVRTADERAWKSLEIAPAGESLWGRLDRPEDRAFRDQVRAFLDALPLPACTGKWAFRGGCPRGCGRPAGGKTIRKRVHANGGSHENQGPRGGKRLGTGATPPGRPGPRTAPAAPPPPKRIDPRTGALYHHQIPAGLSTP